MDKLKIFILFFSISSCFLVQAEDQESTIEYNIGIIPPDRVFTKTYDIKEEVYSAVSMCECVEVDLIKEKGFSKVEIEFNPAEYKGLTIVEVKLLCKGNKVITLRLRAYVQAKQPAGQKNPYNQIPLKK
ncbi:MAG: hypothetical protein PHP17_01070 [Candidatus Omnitrophica bacterium]|nr:hypothetical protein [Candidatus Omnitrophota bacterium]